MDMKSAAAPAQSPVLGDIELEILEAMPDDGVCFSFEALEAQIDDPRFSRPMVEAGVRLLAARGFAQFRRGLFNEDGETYGSGYCATEAGRQFYWNTLRASATQEAGRG